MEIVDRYLKAVRFWLPAPQKDDITSELAEEIRSQVADAEEERGRALKQEEVEAILERLGSPLVVAGRYSRAMERRHGLGSEAPRGRAPGDWTDVGVFLALLVVAVLGLWQWGRDLRRVLRWERAGTRSARRACERTP